jgi:hypothetical protein
MLNIDIFSQISDGHATNLAGHKMLNLVLATIHYEIYRKGFESGLFVK